jgi:crotonobetainyl-CoA:carnitine CoA-transferase CaiB-like acyl-CoA transferase
MTRALEGRDSADWLRELTVAGVPCSPINDLGDVFSGAYATEREFVRHVAHPYNNRLPTVANPVKFSASTVDYENAPPLLGEHTNEVLIDWLGYSDAAIERLRRAGTI